MIQDIESHKLDNRYDPSRKPQPYDAVIPYYGRKLLIGDPLYNHSGELHNSGRLTFLTVAEYLDATPTLAAASDLSAAFAPRQTDTSAHYRGASANYGDASAHHGDASAQYSNASAHHGGSSTSPNDLIYLFSVDNRAFFLSQVHLSLPGYKYATVREIRAISLYPQEYIFAAFTAAHLGEWYRRKRFCGACGSEVYPDDKERAMRCPSCGEVYYPRINPAVIVGVINKDCLLITRYQHGYGHNALVAGFTEIGETLEDTVVREVMEETGLRVKNIRYYKSQPWGIASDLLAGFFCDVDGDDTVTLDGQELKSAVWTPRAKITWQPPEYSLTSDMMKAFHDGLVNPLS